MDDSTRAVDPSGILEAGEFREFAKVLRQALLMVVRYLEKRYGL